MPAISLGPAGNWIDGTINGAFYANFNGYGSNTSNGSVLTQTPQPVYAPSVTSAALVTTVASYSAANLTIDVDVINNAQTRQGSTPNQWEAPWIFWNHENVAAGPNGVADSYYVTLGTSYLSLGRATNGNVTAQNPTGAVQCFFADGPPSSATPVGASAHIQIKQIGSLIEVRKNGVLVISHNETGSDCGPTKTNGKIGLYTEDASVTWSNLVVDEGIVTAPVWTTSTKNVSAASVQTGGSLTYTILVKNSGTAAGSAVVTDAVPAGLTGVAWSAPGCSPSSGNGAVSTTTPSIAPGGQLAITITATAPNTVGTVPANTAVVAGYSVSTLSVAVTSNALCGPGSGTPVPPVLDWNGTPSCGPGSTGYGARPATPAGGVGTSSTLIGSGSTPWTPQTNNAVGCPPPYLPSSTLGNTGFDIRNQGGGTCTWTIDITYWTLSKTWATATHTGTMFNGGQAVGVSAFPTVPPDCDPNGVFTFTISGTVTHDGGGLPNLASIVWGIRYPVPAVAGAASDITCATINDVPCGDFSTSTKTTTAVPVYLGEPVTYTVTVKNTGVASSTTVVDTISPALTDVTWSCPGASPSSGSGNAINLTTPVIPTGGQLVLTITGTAATPGVLTNIALVGTTNVTAPPVTILSPVSATKASDVVGGEASIGQVVTYTITVFNNGAVPKSVTLQEQMPYGLGNASWSAPGSTPPSGTGTMVTTTPLIPGAGQYTATVTATVAAPVFIAENTVLVDGVPYVSDSFTGTRGLTCVSGHAPAGSSIKAYDGRTLVGFTTAAGDGTYSICFANSVNQILVYATPLPGQCLRLVNPVWSTSNPDGGTIGVVPPGVGNVTIDWVSYPRKGCNC